MGFCHDCVENFEGNKCPKCGKVIVSGNTKVIAVCLSLFFAFICLYFFIDAISSESSDAAGNVTNSIKQNDNSNKYEVVEAPNVKQDMFSIYIQGAMRNKTNKTYSYAQITFNLYDENEYHIGTAIANINNWEAGGVWKYSAMALSPNGNVKSYKLADVTMF